MSLYGFRLMTTDDLPIVRAWITTPEVAPWWDADDDFEDALAGPDTRPWIASFENRPFAYIQDYDPHAWPGHPFAFLPRGSRGIDQFIGAPELIGRGHGSALIRQHVERLFAYGAPAVGTDPHPDNGRAIRAYEKAGFTAGEARDTDWGFCLLMTRYRE